MNENIISKTREIKVGYYSMGISSVLAGVLLVLSQLDYNISNGIFILWPIMMILLGLEIILTKAIGSLKKSEFSLKPSWGIILICGFLVGCSQIWIMLMDLNLY